MDASRRNLLVGGGLTALLSAVGVFRACTRQDGRRKWIGRESSRPARPPGQPKPMLDADIGPTLARLDAWYSAHLPPELYVWNPPATDAEIDTFQRLIGEQFPRAYRQLYRWHDGDSDKDDRFGHIYGLPLLSLQSAAFQWKAWNGVLAQLGGDRYKIPGGAWPEGAVDPAYINPHWIPLTHDGSGNHIGMDFDPWPEGRVGQIILYGRDQDVKAVLAPSLGAFLDWIADLLESGNFRLKTAPDERVLRPFRLQTPPADGFEDGARILLGAPGAFL